MESTRVSARSYPYFRKEIIDITSPHADATNHAPHELIAFPFRVKGKRKTDIIAFGLGIAKRGSDIILYQNPRNRDPTKSSNNVVREHAWERLSLNTLKYPVTCMLADVSPDNGCNDLIIIDEYGTSLESPDEYGGRVSWLENFTTDDGDWTRRDIGRSRGLNCLRVGHFTTTYSLQILAVAKSTNPKSPAPLVIFTRPNDVYKSRHWLATTALENEFTGVCDCLVVKASDGLDSVIVSSREGLTVVWYSDKRWYRKSISPSFPIGQGSPGQLVAGKTKTDDLAFIVSAEVINPAYHGNVLCVYIKDHGHLPNLPVEKIPWSRIVLDDFDSADEIGSNSSDIACADLDGDGTDEIIVAVSSQGTRAGIYYYVLVNGRFIKYKISNESTRKISIGRFADRSLDIAALPANSPSTLTLYFKYFLSSEIKLSIENSELIIHIPRTASLVNEAEIIDVCGRIHSLVLLPPNSFLSVPTDGTNAVKVLQGTLGWIDSHGVLIERTRDAGLPGCVTSLLVDSPEGYVRSGNDGAVFVRMRPSETTSDANLRAVNVVPQHFPCEVRDVEFVWGQAGKQPWCDLDETIELYHMPGFHINFDSADERGISQLAYMHLWTAAPGVSSSFRKHNISPSQLPCSTRVCLSNPTGGGGIGLSKSKSDAVPRADRTRRIILPAMHEHAPIWRAYNGMDVDRVGQVDVIQYPWHAWVAGKQEKLVGKAKWDVWAAYDFPPFMPDAQLHESFTQSCIIS
ncbi:hypothetical protein BD410DRAFT_521178 [Rickenella mellea]|uniref:Uncharacterized protein n=1 Tax=Rickenella mellea TaxID=50990 RepID=A0A4Y7QGH0_9AGAM|nr:hypothetical protein BD410DRAFT_521178 [Rickenella mellea]